MKKPDRPEVADAFGDLGFVITETRKDAFEQLCKHWLLQYAIDDRKYIALDLGQPHIFLSFCEHIRSFMTAFGKSLWPESPRTHLVDRKGLGFGFKSNGMSVIYKDEESNTMLDIHARNKYRNQERQRYDNFPSELGDIYKGEVFCRLYRYFEAINIDFELPPHDTDWNQEPETAQRSAKQSISNQINSAEASTSKPSILPVTPEQSRKPGRWSSKKGTPRTPRTPSATATSRLNFEKLLAVVLETTEAQDEAQTQLAPSYSNPPPPVDSAEGSNNATSPFVLSPVQREMQAVRAVARDWGKRVTESSPSSHSVPRQSSVRGSGIESDPIEIASEDSYSPESPDSKGKRRARKSPRR